MHHVMRFLSAVLTTTALLVGVSCSRAPDHDQNLPPTPANSSSPHIDLGGIPVDWPLEFSAPNDTYATIETSPPIEDTENPLFTGSLGLDMDINSGDLRGLKPQLEPGDRYVVFESRLSKEVRRLGISIPQERQWRVLGRVPSGGVEIMNLYGSLLPTIDRLLDLLDETRATDELRRDVLERLMTCMRTSKPLDTISEVRSLCIEVKSKGEEPDQALK